MSYSLERCNIKLPHKTIYVHGDLILNLKKMNDIVCRISSNIFIINKCHVVYLKEKLCFHSVKQGLL